MTSNVNIRCQRQVIRVELTPLGKNRLYDAVACRGMTLALSIDALTAWLGRQPAGVQAAILGQYPDEIAADVATLVLQRMTAASNTTAPPVKPTTP